MHSSESAPSASAAAQMESKPASSSLSKSAQRGGVTGVRMENSWPSAWSLLLVIVSRVPSSVWPSRQTLRIGTMIQQSTLTAFHIAAGVVACTI